MTVSVHAIIPVARTPWPDLQRICELRDAPVRNLLITQRYHELSVSLRATLGLPDVNWATFATWASKTAGKFIRNEHVPAFVQKLLDTEQRVQSGLGRVVFGLFGKRLDARDPFELVRAATERVSREIAAGNLEVFRELAPLLASFNALIGPLRGPDEAVFAQFASALRPGPTPLGGQDALARAFRVAAGYFPERSSSSRSGRSSSSSTPTTAMRTASRAAARATGRACTSA